MAAKVTNSFVEIRDGEFQRKPTAYHTILTPADVKKGRYALYVSLACPWAHRCLIFRALKGLQSAIEVYVVHPVWGPVLDTPDSPKSWVFGGVHGEEVFGGVSVVDGLYNSRSLYDLYHRSDCDYAGKTTVPVLWDKETQKIVNNESSEIIRMFNDVFNEVADHPEVNLFPEELREKIDAVDERMYQSFNNGVYRAGFATSQGPHEVAAKQVFEFLDYAEDVLGKTPYLCGDVLTESDIRMFVTAVRFDSVYHVHFKLARRTIENHYPNVRAWLARVQEQPAILQTVSIPHIKHHYYRSHPTLNPYGLVPLTDEDELPVVTKLN